MNTIEPPWSNLSFEWALHPARLVPIGFLAAIALGTVLLALPPARVGDGGAPILTALFTSTSAVCVTGLIVVDTPTYWSPFGQGVILALFQVGGFGIMTGATLLGVLLTRRLGLGARRLAQAETPALRPGDVKHLLRMILIATVTVELIIAGILSAVWHDSYAWSWPEALWHGTFHAISAFNNAGFSTFSDSLMGFVGDPWINLPVMVAIILGGIGFPVLYDLRQTPGRPRRWSLHTKVTLIGTALLLTVGFVLILLIEWSNPATLAPLNWSDKLLASAFHSVTMRTAGFNSLDIGQMQPESLAVNYLFMLIGGGSAGTAGGIKVSTVVILALVVWAEVRGHRDVTAHQRRIPTAVQRQALTILVLSAGIISLGILLLLAVTDFHLADIVFESISAFATVGLSTGITGDLPAAGQFVIIVLMFVGRVGPITAATAIALRRRPRPYRYAEERLIVG